VEGAGKEFEDEEDFVLTSVTGIKVQKYVVVRYNVKNAPDRLVIGQFCAFGVSNLRRSGSADILVRIDSSQTRKFQQLAAVFEMLGISR
jgi:hypothetical protein